MTLDTVHPELTREQEYVDRAYGYMKKMLGEVSRLRPIGRNDFEQEAFDRWQRSRVAALSDTMTSLVFGRIDRDDDETFYIGRQHVRDDEYNPLVIDWRAPVSKAFYQANRTDRMGVRLRRQFLVDGQEVLGISDEDLSAADGDLRGEDVLAHELSRARTGTMRDIVSTIQAEQDAIIRAPLEGLIVVQGGPGTGKTAIGLHRAAFLLYEYRQRLERMGALVLGPNPLFIRYVEQVLPSLGEAAVMQLATDDLAPWVRIRGVDEARTARLKGDARMAEVLSRALADRRRPAGEDVHMRVDGHRFVLPASVIDERARTLRERGAIYRDGREMLREQLLLDAYNIYVDSLVGDVSAPFEDVVSLVRHDRDFRRALDNVWPSVTPHRLVDDLLSSPSRLQHASQEVLTDAERKLLRRPRSPADSTAWTVHDKPLLDEARALIEGPPDRYGHVVVDEAQDLSPMQLRMIGRRCPHGSATILGDLAQASGLWAHDSWEEVLEHLPAPDGARVEELTLGYRVSPAIMDVANAVLSEAAPHLRPPRSVRREAGEVAFARSAPIRLGPDAARIAGFLSGRGGSVAVIVPREHLDEVATAMRDASLVFGEADRQGLEHPVTLVPVDRCKGLEFDSVVVVEPGAIAATEGLRLLYVALTRAMRSLAVVWSTELPGSLAPRGLAAS